MKSSAIFCAVLFVSATAIPQEKAPMETCGEQADCIAIDIGPPLDLEQCSSPGCSGETVCEFEICLTLELNKDACNKDARDTVSHTCTMDPFVCTECWDSLPVFPDDTEEGELSDGHMQCQTVPQGGFAHFILKDGAGACNDDTCGCASGTDHPADPNLSGASCTPTTDSNVNSCTGGGNIGKECFWTVQAPTDCDDSGIPDTAPPVSNCPKGKGVCFTEDCACILGNCKNREVITLDDLPELIFEGDGEYPIPLFCPDGKALSNTVDLAKPCWKTEVGDPVLFDATFYWTEDDWDPFTMKCGNTCYLVAPGVDTTFEDFLACND